MPSVESWSPSPAVAVLRFNRPERRNAMDSALLAELEALLEQLATGPELRVLVFSSTTEDALSAGADVGEKLDREGGLARLEAFARVYAAVEAFPVPTIAVCRGACVGAGAELAAGCDLRVGAANLRIGWSGAKMGVPVGPARLVPLVGLARAKELIFTGRLLDASQAHALGLLHGEVVEPAAAEDAALALAEEVAALPAEGLRLLKGLFRELEDTGGRVAHENDALRAFQRDGAGLPQRW